MKKKVVQEGNVFTLLDYSGNVSTCPYKPNMILPPRIQGGPVQINAHPCTSNCPLFQADEVQGETGEPVFRVRLTCGSQATIISNIETKEPF